MLSKLVITAAVVAALATPAHAVWTAGPEQTNAHVTARLSYEGYAGLYPNVGERKYVKVTVTASTFSTSYVHIELPPYAVLTADDENFVWCQVFGSFQSSWCYRPPPASMHGRLFASATMYPGEFLEVLVPVHYTFAAVGTLKATVISDGTVMPLSMPLPSYGPPSFIDYASAPDVTGFNANVHVNLINNHRGGTLVFEFGTTTSFGSQISESVPDSGPTQWPTTFMLDGLAPATRYYWRPVFIYSPYNTRYEGVVQEFTTKPAQLGPPRPSCPRYPCVRN